MTADLPVVCEGETRFSSNRLRSSTARRILLKPQGPFLKFPLPDHCPIRDSGSLRIVIIHPPFSPRVHSCISRPPVAYPSMLVMREELNGILLPSYDADNFLNQETDDSDFYGTLIIGSNPPVNESPTDTPRLH
jgi:hypothetical protein